MAAETSIERARRIAKEKREGKNKKPTGRGKKPATNVGNKSKQAIDALDALEQGIDDADTDSKRKK